MSRLVGGEFLLHAPFRNLSDRSREIRQVGSLSYTLPAEIYPVIRQVGVSLYTPRAGICLVVSRVGSLYYMPRAGMYLVVLRVGSFS